MNFVLGLYWGALCRGYTRRKTPRKTLESPALYAPVMPRNGACALFSTSNEAWPISPGHIKHFYELEPENLNIFTI